MANKNTEKYEIRKTHKDIENVLESLKHTDDKNIITSQDGTLNTELPNSNLSDAERPNKSRDENTLDDTLNILPEVSDEPTNEKSILLPAPYIRYAKLAETLILKGDNARTESNKQYSTNPNDKNDFKESINLAIDYYKEALENIVLARHLCDDETELREISKTITNLMDKFKHSAVSLYVKKTSIDTKLSNLKILGDKIIDLEKDNKSFKQKLSTTKKELKILKTKKIVQKQKKEKTRPSENMPVSTETLNLISAHWYGPSITDLSDLFGLYSVYGNLSEEDTELIYAHIEKSKQTEHLLYDVFPLGNKKSALVKRNSRTINGRLSKYVEAYVFSTKDFFKRGRSIHSLISLFVTNHTLIDMQQKGAKFKGNNIPIPLYDYYSLDWLHWAKDNSSYAKWLFSIPHLLDTNSGVRLKTDDPDFSRRFISASLALRKTHTKGITYTEEYEQGDLTIYLSDKNSKTTKDVYNNMDQKPIPETDSNYYNLLCAASKYKVLNTNIFEGIDFLYLESKKLEEILLGKMYSKKLIESLAGIIPKNQTE